MIDFLHLHTNIVGLLCQNLLIGYKITGISARFFMMNLLSSLLYGYGMNHFSMNTILIFLSKYTLTSLSTPFFND